MMRNKTKTMGKDPLFFEPIVAHCWNKDRSLVAVAKSERIIVYASNGSVDHTKWTKKYDLNEHTGEVSGLDWNLKENLIVSCAHDRNAYVWKFSEKEDKWKPTLVILRINRAATAVKWSPEGNKFAVASGAKVVPICSYEPVNDWWVSDHIKKHKSTINTIAWSPNNKFLVTGGCDMKVRICSAYLEAHDTQDDVPGYGWAKQNTLGEVLVELADTKAWVNAVAWSPNGENIAYAGHGSTVHVYNIASKEAQIMMDQQLPHTNLEFINDTTLLASGFSMNPTLYVCEGGQWKWSKELDEAKQTVKKAATSSVSAARSMFQNQSKKGQTKSEETKVFTRHQNSIMSMEVYDGGFSTAGTDGMIHGWDFAKLGVTV